ncbi:MAG TPA: hypothetical protein VMX96_07800 [Dehalococcoidia bacterium]|nr:hypothetical protein [Dehalococcoidia bacterium]
MNFLEQLVAEWYEYDRYFVRSNVRTRKRKKGGYDVELDVLAYDRSKNTLIHIETSGDANSWEERKRQFLNKKFILTTREYEDILGHKVSKIKRIAVVGYVHSTKADLNWGQDIEIELIPVFIKKNTKKLSSQHPMKEAVPEGFPILRAMQMAIAYGT